tara:strand:+ start:576 stop:806 length:231 start_codon:yes stop_codon:yes gene_type:complete
MDENAMRESDIQNAAVILKRALYSRGQHPLVRVITLRWLSVERDAVLDGALLAAARVWRRGRLAKRREEAREWMTP